MGAKLQKKDKCFYSFMNRQPRGTLAALSPAARAAFRDLVYGAIEEVMEDRPAAHIRTIVRQVATRIQDKCDEIRVRDANEQAIAKVIEAAMDRFLANSNLGGADPATGDEIAGLVGAYIEQVVAEGQLTNVGDIIEEATDRAEAGIDEILDLARSDNDEEMCDA